MVKILFIITQSELGGAQRWVFDVATNLDKKQYDIIVTSQPGPLLERLKEKQIKTLSTRNLTRNLNPLKDVLGLMEIYRLIKKEKPDVLQLCSTKAGLLGAIAGKLVATPKIIYRIGGWSFNDPRPRWQNLIFLWLEKLTAPLKNKIIVNSQKGYSEAIKHKIASKEKLVLLYNGINWQDSKYKIQGAKGKLVVGVIANDYPAKGLKYLPKDPTLKFVIIGRGGLIGAKDEPWKYFAETGIDIFVIPSLKEGLPYVLLEAMAAGLPIVTTNVGGIPEIIKDKENGILVPPKNTEALAQAIRLLADNPDLRKKLGHKARENVKQFSLEKMLNELNSLILSISPL